ncbi:mechanosensitive ion channel domain-containing protein [Sphingobacterium deserti]|uniref:Mechanosensitive ion channel protein n=1 Tax=Sphingobacterium deserti TaxID=1229276 RepID=A0A0B8T5T4_9SPHI|nr:mechanosensitive ion channel domain-containing protein [Sphingobacterium deserti]KGE12280.1 mechanosensitive ion channel protein [Sphingobacterium deserti]
MKNLRSIILFCAVLWPWISLAAAHSFDTQDSTVTRVDTARKDYVASIEEFFRHASLQSDNDLALDRALIRQGRVFEEIKVVSRQARSFLKKGFDSVTLRTQLKEVMNWHRLAGDGVFENRGTAHTSRNLTATYNILNALQIQVLSYKKQVDDYQEQLVSYRLQIDSLSNDKSLFVFSRDSSELSEYIKKIKLLSKAISPINKQLTANINDVQAIQDEVNLALLTLENSVEEILYYQREIANKTFVREFAPLWKKSEYDRSLQEIQYFSRLKAQLVLTYYVKAHLGKIAILLLLLTVVIWYIYMLKRGVLSNSRKPKQLSMLLFSPVLSGVVIALSAGQFIFPNPPFIFSTIILFATSIALTLSFRRFISKYWMAVWLSIFVLFLLASLDNMVLQASRPERYVMMAIGLLAALTGGIALLNRKKHEELQEKWILFPIALMSVLEMSAVLLNIFGLFNIAKALMIAGLLNVLIAIIFLWVVRLVNEGLSYASQLYTKQERRLFYINYNRVGQRAPAFFYALLVVGWFVLFGRNFYEFRFLSEPLHDFLYDQHQLGSYSFSVISIVVFFLIMLGATVLSKVVSFFAADPQWNTREEKDDKKFHLGSWILLVRISILMLGFFFAFSAVGIPLQQITLVISALGVGIGFGLQTLVNNLVSGLIIAFEKPVNVDDLIEVGGQSGKVKSIGFRSSVIATADGADLIMPNGDLLNSHVVNWTLGGFRKRLHIRLDVQYGTNLDQTRELLLVLFEKQDQVLANPATVVQFADVTAQSVGIDIYFWVKTLKDASQIKSDILVSVSAAFQEHGIRLSISQQEIHISQEPRVNERADREDGKK